MLVSCWCVRCFVAGNARGLVMIERRFLNLFYIVVLARRWSDGPKMQMVELLEKFEKFCQRVELYALSPKQFLRGRRRRNSPLLLPSYSSRAKAQVLCECHAIRAKESVHTRRATPAWWCDNTIRSLCVRVFRGRPRVRAVSFFKFGKRQHHPL